MTSPADEIGQAAQTIRVTGSPTHGPSWLVWTAPDESWEVTYGDDGGGLEITVSAGPHAGPRWFRVTDPRGLAAALLAAADRMESQP